MKFCIFISTCLSLVFYGVVGPANINLDDFFSGDYAFYSTAVIESPLITSVDFTGFSYIYHCKSSNASKIRPLFTDEDGESVTFIGNIQNTAVLKNLGARIVSESDAGGIGIIYAYTPKISAYITENGKKINLQIAQREETTTIGWPVILGSY